MPLLMRIAIIGLKILGPSRSNLVASNGSKAFMYDCTCSDVTHGILKKSEGIRSFGVLVPNFGTWAFISF